MSNAFRAEWTKLRTTPGPWWLLAATATLTVALGSAVTAASGVESIHLALSGVYLGQAPIAVLAVLVVSGEYSTALISTTLTAIPNRPIVLAAKALVLTVLVAAVGTPAVLASLLLPGRLPADGPALRAGAGSVAYLILIAILSLGVAAVVRDSAVAIGAVLGLLFLPPILTQMVANPHLHRLLDRAAPTNAGLAIGPWAGLGVLAAWTAGTLLAGTLALRFRDT